MCKRLFVNSKNKINREIKYLICKSNKNRSATHIHRKSYENKLKLRFNFAFHITKIRNYVGRGINRHPEFKFQIEIFCFNRNYTYMQFKVLHQTHIRHYISLLLIKRWGNIDLMLFINIVSTQKITP